MTGIPIPKPIASSIAVALVGLSLHPFLIGSEQKTASVADCSFSIDPDRFLSREANSRRDLNGRVKRFQSLLSRAQPAPAPAVAAASIPQRGFIDQEIF